MTRSRAAADGGAVGHPSRASGSDASAVRAPRSSGADAAGRAARESSADAGAAGRAARAGSADSSTAGRAARSSGPAADGAANNAPVHTRKSARDGTDSAPAAPSGAPGLLRINSRPWSQVTLDGAAVGHTPLIDLRVAPGSHSLRLVNPEFGLSKSIQVKVAAGETVTRVELLEP